MEDLDILKKMTGEQDEMLLLTLLQSAEGEILSRTNRTKINTRLKPYVRKWALTAYNRMGTEGELSRSGGGISSSFVEVPADIQAAIEENRIARVGGHAYEKVTDKDIQS